MSCPEGRQNGAGTGVMQDRYVGDISDYVEICHCAGTDAGPPSWRRLVAKTRQPWACYPDPRRKPR
jgi:hypothetical protein